MKKMLVLATSALMLVACSEKPGYEISGTVNNPALEGKCVYLYPYGDAEAAPLDSAVVTNGTFVLKGTQDSAALRILKFSEEVVAPSRTQTGENGLFSATFVLSNAKLQAALDSLSDVTGTPENDALAAFRKDMRAMRAEQETLEAALKSEDEAAKREAEQKYDAIDHSIAEKAEAFIGGNIENPLAAVLFYGFRYELPEDAQNGLVAKAGDTFKSVPGIRPIMERLENLKKVAVGKKFTDFPMKDVNGKDRKLSDYVGNGKVVLIDFWASWCPPCRREMPNLVEVYKQYKAKGFEIVGVSLDSKQEAWEKGIKDLNITWPQLSDLQGWKNSGAALYYVNSIPHTILVDKDGTIVAKNLHGEEIGAKVAELLK